MSCKEAVPLWWQLLWLLAVVAVVSLFWAGYHLAQWLKRKGNE